MPAFSTRSIACTSMQNTRGSRPFITFARQRVTTTLLGYPVTIRHAKHTYASGRHDRTRVQERKVLHMPVPALDRGVVLRTCTSLTCVHPLQAANAAALDSKDGGVSSDEDAPERHGWLFWETSSTAIILFVGCILFWIVRVCWL
jgi:hypothetical protein